MALEALIFDVDGTLSETERDGHLVAFNRAFKEAGLDWHWSEALYGELLAVTGGKERIRFYLDKYNTGFERPDNLDEFIAGLHASKTSHYVDLLATGGIPLRKGVIRLLDEARAEGLRLAIATTTTVDNVTALLEHAVSSEAIDWFEVIGAGDVVPAKKPAPDIYNYVLEKMNLKPEQCMAFEDSANGIKSAGGAGLPIIITVDSYTTHHDFTGARLILDNMGEPDQPFKVIGGSHASVVTGDDKYLNIDLVRRIHSA
ncbi:MAG: HAD family hydrolase [Gammaproteobacteria bacterium]|nr:HAD family hydrolase [Gammaproteobacteria bacterium]MDH5593326.1 HAD family hydrolase [Gammaproteobacteria bacterium]